MKIEHLIEELQKKPEADVKIRFKGVLYDAEIYSDGGRTVLPFVICMKGTEA